jgi:hypothetical protein
LRPRGRERAATAARSALDVERWTFSLFCILVTMFVGCGFAAKYLAGGGNFSVPLQWMLGLQRLKHDAIWLEVLPPSGDGREDRAKIENFRRQLREHGLANRYCLLRQRSANTEHDLEEIECVGISKRNLLERLTGPNTLLNLSYSIHPPLLLKFERRILCDLDPSEIFYWMTKMDLGQSTHHEFWTIGLNVNGKDCRLPKSTIKWKTFYPLVDTKLVRRLPRPRVAKFTTIGQWYWSGAVEVDGDYPDLSKKLAFEQYLDLPKRVPEAKFELAMNINADDPELARLENLGWRVVDPHRIARTPKKYRRYVAGALAEFTAIKGVDVAWRTGWVSDRAATFLASGRPVVTEETGAAKYLPRKSGFHFVRDETQAIEAARRVLLDWPQQSKIARECAVGIFDSARNLQKILDG